MRPKHPDERTWLKGLIVECPLDKALPSCPLNGLRNLPTLQIRHIVRQMSEEGTDSQGGEPKVFPKVQMALLPPQKRERVAITPIANRRQVLQLVHGSLSHREQFEIACGDCPALVMIYEKLKEIESGLEDNEDRLEACDCWEKWEAAEIQKMQQILRELHDLVGENWRKQHREAGLFVAAIHQLTTKFEQVQARNDHALWAIMEELKQCRTKFAQVHHALSDVVEMLGLTKKTMQEADETIMLMRETKGIGKGKDEGKPQDMGTAV